MNISAFCYTNQGGREHNEDSVRCCAGEDRGIFVLADGLGGHGCGEVASALAADVLYDGIAAGNPDTGELCALFQEANAAILRQHAVPGQEDMKTTAAALSITPGRAVWGHIGDSRLYRFSGHTLVQATHPYGRLS